MTAQLLGIDQRTKPIIATNGRDCDGESVVVEGLTKRFGSFTAVDSVSFSVPTGSIYGFLGPNGAGKTTTLGMMLGLVPATSGSVRLLGYDTATHLHAALRRTGAMVERPGLYPYLTGRQNLELWAYLAGIRDPKRIDEALATVDLHRRADAKFGSYSTGMKQRLGIATALLRNPDLVILDEPTSGLDPAGQREVRQLVKSLSESGRTVMLSSHLLYEVQEVCTDVAIIDRGKLVTAGSMDEILATRDSIEIKVDRPADAEAFVAHLPHVERVTMIEGRLVVGVPVSEAGSINRQLIQAGFEVTELKPREQRLEDHFLSLTDHN